jgi:hypothetical protein
VYSWNTSSVQSFSAALRFKINPEQSARRGNTQRERHGQGGPMNISTLLMVSASLIAPLSAQVTLDRILHADREPQNWLTYSGPVGLASQVDGEVRDRRAGLQRRSLYHRSAEQRVCTRRHHRPHLLESGAHARAGNPCLPRTRESRACRLGRHAVHGDLDGHVLAIDSKNGKVLWNTNVSSGDRYAITHAPLIVKDK